MSGCKQFWLPFVMMALLVACTPADEAVLVTVTREVKKTAVFTVTPVPPPTVTKTAVPPVMTPTISATMTEVTTVVVESAPMETAEPEPATTLSVCIEGAETAELPEQPTGPLRVVYSSGGQAGIWREELNSVELFPLPPDATGVVVTADTEHIAFSRHPNDGLTEIWAMDSDGSNVHKLASLSKSEFLARQEDYVVDANLSYHWIGDTHNLAHTWVPILNAIGQLPYDAVTVVTAEDANPRVVVPAGEVNAYTYSPDGSQIAALTNTELRIINTADGSMQFTVPSPLFALSDQSMAYSPDGRYLVVFTVNGIAIINPANGDSQDIPLAYEPIGLGHTSLMPGIHWLPDGTNFYTLIADSENVFALAATFTVWQVNVAEATAVPLHTFTGSVLEATFSPDARYLAFWTQQENNRTLYLADVARGEEVEYDNGRLIEFLGWNPDSTHFGYWFAEEQEPLLGQLCGSAVPLNSAVRGMQWVDTNRFLEVTGESTNETDGQWQIHLRSVDGLDTLVATVEGPYPSFSFTFAR